jgi:toxoflavin synthase
MTTNYDPIAEKYKRSKQQPWRAFVEAFTLMRLVGDPTAAPVGRRWTLGKSYR